MKNIFLVWIVFTNILFLSFVVEKSFCLPEEHVSLLVRRKQPLLEVSIPDKETTGPPILERVVYQEVVCSEASDAYKKIDSSSDSDKESSPESGQEALARPLIAHSTSFLEYCITIIKNFCSRIFD